MSESPARSPGFRLEHRGRAMALQIGEYTVGRGHECDLILDDPLVSRKHACFRVTSDRVTVEDLGSKNGLRVNGLKADGAVRLAVGDLVTIGAHDFVLRAGDDTPAPSLRDWLRSADVTTLGDTQSETRASNAVSLLVSVTERAFAAGDLSHAERVVRSMVQSVRSHFAHGATMAEDVLLSAAQQALTLAERTGSTEWVDAVFQMYRAGEIVLDVVLVDQLQRVCPQLSYQPSAAMNDYLEALLRDPSRLTAYHRFLLQRVETLRRELLAHSTTT